MTQSLRDRAIAAAKRWLPPGVRGGVVRLQRRLRLQWPPTGTVRFGSLRRLTPISPIFARDRGQSVDRYYIESFLDRHRADIRGRVMEFGDTTYIDRFGDDRVTRKDVFSYVPAGDATIVGDLTKPAGLPAAAFDCIICTQTVQMIYDIRTAVRTLCDMLKPGGVLLLTTDGTARIGRHLDIDGWGEYWHLTPQGATSLFEDAWRGEADVQAWGNVLAAVCVLHGISADEMAHDELEYRDRSYPVTITVRAVKGVATGRSG